jgi:hypothetical protein
MKICERAMAKPGRKTNISKGKSPPQPNSVASKKSRAKTREIKFMQFYFRAEAMIMNSIALHGLAGDIYHTPSGARIEPKADVDGEPALRLWREVLEDTDWAVTGGEPPDGWIPPKWVSRSK